MVSAGNGDARLGISATRATTTLTCTTARWLLSGLSRRRGGDGKKRLKERIKEPCVAALKSEKEKGFGTWNLGQGRQEVGW